MAAIKSETQLMDRKQLLCRFHIRGSCREGERCPFSHDSNLSVPIPDTVCWYYLQSHCMYGDNCRFVHLDASSILANHRLSQENVVVVEDEPQLLNTGITAPTLPQLRANHLPLELSPQQSIAHNNCYNNSNSETINKKSINSSNSYPKITPHLVPFNKPITTCSQLNQSSNTSRITDSRQSSEDSGYSEPANSSVVNALSSGGGGGSSGTGSTSTNNPNCSTKTYAQMASNNDTNQTNQRTNNSNTVFQSIVVYNKDTPLCPFDGGCPYPEGQCHYLHGNVCDLCGRYCLNPNDIEQQKQHRDECIKEHEREMEISFAVQRSLDKACGICMDIVIEKEPITERRFGILEKCSHIFCLSCIRKWRQTKQFDNRTIRACPECRVASDFVIPSKYWYDERSEKQQLIDSYKKALSIKPCKYFKQGQGECPFAGACFYLHAYPDGRKAEMPPPRQRRRQNHDGELETLRDMLLWNYLEVRDDNHWLLTLDLEDVFDIQEMGLLSGYETDDESDLSDYAENLIG